MTVDKGMVGVVVSAIAGSGALAQTTVALDGWKEVGMSGIAIAAAVYSVKYFTARDEKKDQLIAAKDALIVQLQREQIESAAKTADKLIAVHREAIETKSMIANAVNDMRTTMTDLHTVLTAMSHQLDRDYNRN